MPIPSVPEASLPRAWNVGPMHAAPRCGARTRSGHACRAHAVRARARCRMHGGARGSGAQAGNTNALKHGEWSRAARARRRWTAELIALAEATLARLGPDGTGDAEDWIAQGQAEGARLGLKFHGQARNPPRDLGRGVSSVGINTADGFRG